MSGISKLVFPRIGGSMIRRLVFQIMRMYSAVSLTGASNHRRDTDPLRYSWDKIGGSLIGCGQLRFLSTWPSVSRITAQQRVQALNRNVLTDPRPRFHLRTRRRIIARTPAARSRRRQYSLPSRLLHPQTSHACGRSAVAPSAPEFGEARCRNGNDSSSSNRRRRAPGPILGRPELQAKQRVFCFSSR